MSSLRACALAMPALRAALAARRVGPAEASGALAAVLQALRTHGQHDANLAALLALAVQVPHTSASPHTVGPPQAINKPWNSMPSCSSAGFWLGRHNLIRWSAGTECLLA